MRSREGFGAPYEEAVASQEKQDGHFSADYDRELLENQELRERAGRVAEFYQSKFSQMDKEDDADMLSVVHFTDDRGLKKIAETNALANKSMFYDCGTEKLERLGFDLDGADREFGREKCVVAIPKDDFPEWAKSLSWLKIVESGISDNVYVFSVPKKDVLVRDASAVDRMFEAHLEGREDVVDEARLDYFNSTSRINETSTTKHSMREVWIPHEIGTDDDFSLFSYEDDEPR